MSRPYLIHHQRSNSEMPATPVEISLLEDALESPDYNSKSQSGSPRRVAPALPLPQVRAFRTRGYGAIHVLGATNSDPLGWPAHNNKPCHKTKAHFPNSPLWECDRLLVMLNPGARTAGCMRSRRSRADMFRHWARHDNLGGATFAFLHGEWIR